MHINFIGGRRLASVFVSFIFISFSFACKLKENIENQVKTENKDEFVFLNQLPGDVVGFYYWNYKSQAYNKLEQYSKNEVSEEYEEIVSSALPTVSQVNDALRVAGINIQDRKFLKEQAKEGVVFLTPYPENGKPTLKLGLLIRSSNKTLSELINKAAKTFKEKNIKHQELVEAGTKGLDVEIEVKDSSCTETQAKCPVTVNHFYIVSNGEIGVVSNSKELAFRMVNTPYNSKPAILESAFRTSLNKLPEEDNRLGFGYVDISQLIPLGNLDTTSKEQADNLKSASLIYSFEKSPKITSKILFNKNSKDVSWLPKLKASNRSDVWKLTPDTPLLVLTSDGSLLKTISELSADKNVKASPEIESTLSSINHMTVSLKVASAGQSLLPVPDLVVVLGSSSVEATKKYLLAQLGALIGSQVGARTMNWNDTSIDGKPVKMIQTPFGFGAFMSSVGNSIILTSTEAQMKQALSSAGNDLSKMHEELRETARSSSVVGIFIDYHEVANLLESMGGVLSMYAPPLNQSELNKIISPEKINRLKNSGQNFIAIDVDSGEGALVITSEYSNKNHQK